MALTKTTRVGMALAVAGLLALAMVGRAGATSPDTFRVPFDETSIEDWSLATCGFEITAHLAGVATIEVLRDRNGNPVRVQIHANGTGTFSANGLEIGQATNDTRF